VPTAGIARRCDLALTQRVSGAHDADIAISKQGVDTQFRGSRLFRDACFEVHGPVTKRRAVFVGLLHEEQPHAGRFTFDAGYEVRSEVLGKAFGRAKCERSSELLKIERLVRA
jgi:hypothetical protein